MMIGMIRRGTEDVLQTIKSVVDLVIERITVKVGIVIAVMSDAKTDMMITKGITGKTHK